MFLCEKRSETRHNLSDGSDEGWTVHVYRVCTRPGYEVEFEDSSADLTDAQIIARARELDPWRALAETE